MIRTLEQLMARWTANTRFMAGMLFGLSATGFVSAGTWQIAHKLSEIDSKITKVHADLTTSNRDRLTRADMAAWASRLQAANRAIHLEVPMLGEPAVTRFDSLEN